MFTCTCMLTCTHRLLPMPLLSILSVLDSRVGDCNVSKMACAVDTSAFGNLEIKSKQG